VTKSLPRLSMHQMAVSSLRAFAALPLPLFFRSRRLHRLRPARTLGPKIRAYLTTKQAHPVTVG
jgi:hypothetical protein